jgi:hypothetical protein
MTSEIHEVVGQRHVPAALFPGKGLETTVHVAGRVSKPVPTSFKKLAVPGFEPRTVQPTAGM